VGGPAELARRLTIAIADEADADQWAVAIDGISGTGPADFEEPFPRSWLESLNKGHPAAYRLTLVLRHAGRDLGVVRLGTFRPCGFQPSQIRRARAAADRAAELLAEILEPKAVATVVGPADNVISFEPRADARRLAGEHLGLSSQPS
jgi:hypothetical protein